LKGLSFVCGYYYFFARRFKLCGESRGFNSEKFADVFLDVALEHFCKICAGDGRSADPIMDVERNIALPTPFADEDKCFQLFACSIDCRSSARRTTSTTAAPSRAKKRTAA